jgi:hypothetical protein
MTVADVIKLSKAGLSDDVIVQQIKKKGRPFDLSTEQLLQLKAAHVSDRVIQVMIDPKQDPAQLSAAPVTTAAPAVPNAKPVAPSTAAAGAKAVTTGAPAKLIATAAPATATKPVTPSAPPADPQQQIQDDRQDPPDSSLPTEIGVYAKENGKWTEVLPEVVYWKSGGVVKHVASAGVVKGDLNGHVNGGSSTNRLASPIEFLIVVPDGVAITEYQLLRLHEREEDREFRAVTGGVFHVSEEASRDVLPFEGIKVATGAYKVNFTSSPGEYGFVPPGAFSSANAESSGKIYSFRLIE